MESTKLSLASESLLRMANELEDIEEEEDYDDSGSLEEYRAQLDQFKKDQEKTKAVLEKIRRDEQNHSNSFMNDQKALDERIVEIQKQMNELDAEKQRLLNEHFSSLHGVSDFITQSSAMMSNTSPHPKSILKKPSKTPDVSQLDSSFNSEVDSIAPSPIQKDKTAALNAKIMEETTFRDQICHAFIKFIDYVAEKNGSCPEFENMKATLEQASNEPSNVTQYATDIDSLIEKLKNSKKSSPERPKSSPERAKPSKDDAKIRFFSTKCHEIAESVLNIFDYTAPTADEILEKPEILTNLTEEISVLVKNNVSEYKKAIYTLKEQNKILQKSQTSAKTSSTVKEVLDLMTQIQKETIANHNALFH